MPSPTRQTRPHGRPGGFTLIELAIVSAIIVVLTALSLAGWQAMRESSALQNAANDFSAVLSQARSRAIERRTDVWLVIFPNRMKNGTGSTTGSYFMVEDDTSQSFRLGGYLSFDPPFTTVAAPARLLSSTYLENYSRGLRVRFVVGNTPTPLIPRFPAPFTTLNASLTAGVACNFCSGTGTAAKGAIVFSGSGTARFVNAAGAGVISGGSDAASRTGYVSISEPNTLQSRRRGYAFAISKPTAFVALYSSP